MKFHRRSITLIFLIPLLIYALAGCSPNKITADPQVEAINTIRKLLDLPDQPLEFVKMSGMINSPSGNLRVALYRDSQGREFLVDPESNQVVEIDARSVLSKIPSNAPALSDEELRSKVVGYFSAAIPDFDTLKSGWLYEEGIKGDNYFYTWYDEITPGAFNRPFAQIAIHKSGELFGFYNTLLIK
jgi:hypothetical protein